MDAPPLPDAPPPYDTVVFDCDSTLSSIEGIDELLRSCAGRVSAPRAAELERLTREAMEGRLPLERVYGRRLELVRPSRADLDHIGRRYVETALPASRELVLALRFLGKRVRILSGGLRPAVVVLGRALGLGEEDVLAVDVRFDDRGDYAGFDEASPLARAGGKPELVRRLRETLASRSMALVGDGATDLEAAPWVERFVAFGGVERRPAVLAAARATCTAADFRALAPWLLSPAEVESLRAAPAHAAFAASLPL